MDFAPLSNNLLAEATKQIIGERRIDMYQTFKANSRNAGRRQRFGNFMGMLGGAATDYFFSNFSQIVMGSVLQLYMFDWAQTDEQIKEQIKSNDLAVLSSLGRLTADGVIRFAGLGATKSAKHRYPQLDPHALAALEEDQRDEFIQTLRGSFIAIRSSVMNNTFLNNYMSGRHMLGWDGTKKSDPWILSKKVEDIAQNQKTPEMKAYLTGLVNQAEDAIFDIAFLACNTVQSTYELTRLATKAAAGPNRVVKFTMDKDAPEEYTWVYGPQQNVINAIETAKIEGAVIASKDVGQIVQMGMDKVIRPEKNERLITVYFYSGVNGATTTPDGKRSKKAQFQISNLKLSADWDKFKAIFVPFESGNYKVVAHLDDGHQLQGNFVTESEGRSYLTSLAQLCNGDIVNWTTIEPNSDPKRRSSPARMTVSTATIRISKKTANEAEKTIIDRKGQYWKVKSRKLALRKPTKPEGIDEWILNPWGA
jgi:hypothetical protein